jgi:hypothetical protein
MGGSANVDRTLGRAIAIAVKTRCERPDNALSISVASAA